MKAEHRKELQTNVLADRMGRLVQKMQTKPQRRSVLYIVGFVVLVACLLVYGFIRHTSRRVDAENWVQLDDGHQDKIINLAKNFDTTPQGKAARNQYEWFMLSERGLKRLAADPKGALLNVRRAHEHYQKVLPDFKDDKVLGSETMYYLAVTKETLTLENEENLKAAKQLYKEVVEQYGDSAHGSLAKKRLKYLEDNATKVTAFYQEFRKGIEPVLQLELEQERKLKKQ